MKRKILVITICYIIGLIWGLYFNKNITLFFCISASAICLIKRKLKYVVWGSIIIIACIYASNIRTRYESTYEGIEECRICGTVEQTIVNSENQKNYIVKVKSLNGNDKYKNTRIILKEKGNGKIEIEEGNLISVYGKFEVAEGRRNYKGFNYNEYLRAKKIYGIVKADSNYIKITNNKNWKFYKKFVHKTRCKIEESIRKILPETTANMCIAILLGDKSDLDENIMKNFSEVSLSHIIAVSGMHMSYIIEVISVALMIFGKKKQRYFSIIFILFFCNLVGNTNSAVRSCIMIVINIVGNLFHRRADSITSISVAALLILILNPYAIIDNSFVLSFLATISLVIFDNIIKNSLSRATETNKVVSMLKDSISSSLATYILLVPVLIMYYNKISIAFVVTNFFSSILVTIIMPLSIFCVCVSFISIKLSSFFAIFLNFFLELLKFLASLFSKFKFLNLTINTPENYIILIYYVFVALVLFRMRPNKKRIANQLIKVLCFIFIVIITIQSINKIANKKLTIYFVDVGQGDCSLIITPSGKKILIDGGGSEKNDYVGEKVLVPYLLDRKAKKIDYIIISHFDSDHVRRNIKCDGEFAGEYCCNFKTRGRK